MVYREEQIRAAEDTLQKSLERYEQAYKAYRKMTDAAYGGLPNDMTGILSAHRELGISRTEVENARLRLHLMNARDKADQVEAEYRRKNPGAQFLGDRLGDLGTLGEARVELKRVEEALKKAEETCQRVTQRFEKNDCRPTDMLLAIKGLAEAEAKVKVARARVLLIEGDLDVEWPEEIPVI